MPALNPEIIKWARETSGLSLEDAARCLGISKIERLIALESGYEAPSRSVLLKMAKQYRRSLLTFYLSAPPQKGDRGEDFRTATTDRSIADDALLDALIRDLRTRQSLVQSTLEEEEAEPLAFVGSTNMADGIAPTLKCLQQILQLNLRDFRAQKKAEDAFSLLRTRSEAAGIFVLLIGNLGSHHSAIPVETFRGFAIANPIAPFIVINDKDAKTAWSFTLLHEIAHLCLGTTGISGALSDVAIEQFCNDVAGEFLLPKGELDMIQFKANQNLEESIVIISEFAEARNLSRSMVAYKLFRTGFISWKKWRALDSKLRELWVQEKAKSKDMTKSSESGPNYYIVRRHRLGKAILEFASRTVNSGTLSPVKAAKVLGVKPRSVYPLLVDISRSGLGNVPRGNV